MEWVRLRELSPRLVSGFGAVLFLTAFGFHAVELTDIDDFIGPVLALVLSGVPSLTLVYAGYWLSKRDLSPRHQGLAVLWCFIGAGVFLLELGATITVRMIEDRVVAEPGFPLLVAAAVGGNAGFLAGYYHARALAEMTHAREVGRAFGFINNVIRHDLRNDLNVIRGNAELIDDNGAESGGDPSVIEEKADEALRRIKTSGAVAETLTGEADTQHVDLADITTEFAAQTDQVFGVEVTSDIPAEAPVAANAGLRSVVDNLLENAVEHSGETDPRVEVNLETDGETVRLTVADNGPGIPEGELRSLRQSSTVNPDMGGLSIVQTLVENYRGEVRFSQPDSGGTRVTVELPQADSPHE